jgi:hypothetical protein
MATYKVPQDVEADDKLIGPFSFRQFIYLIIVALAGAAAWGLYHLFPLLIVIPLPVVVFFGALALPLRKDQPMEVYMAAMVSFYLKPRRRLWDADGLESLIEITVPKTIEYQRTKNITQSEAQQRFGYLAELVDSQGWAVRGQGVQAPNSAMTSDAYFEAQQTEDILDSTAPVAQNLDYMIGQSDAKRHQDMMDRMRQPVATVAQPAQTVAAAPNPYDFFASQQPIEPSVPTTPVVTVTPTSDPIVTPQPVVAPVDSSPVPTYNPYPTQIQQSVLQPLAQPSVEQPVTTSEKPISPGIMNLANNADLSIETIAREANRIREKEEMNEEVVISLR